MQRTISKVLKTQNFICIKYLSVSENWNLFSTLHECEKVHFSQIDWGSIEFVKKNHFSIHKTSIITIQWHLNKLNNHFKIKILQDITNNEKKQLMCTHANQDYFFQITLEQLNKIKLQITISKVLKTHKLQVPNNTMSICLEGKNTTCQIAPKSHQLPENEHSSTEFWPCKFWRKYPLVSFYSII